MEEGAARLGGSAGSRATGAWEVGLRFLARRATDSAMALLARGVSD